MDKKEFAKLTMEKFKNKLKSGTKYCMVEIATIGLDHNLVNSKKMKDIDIIAKYAENLTGFRGVFDYIDGINIEFWIEYLNFYFAFISILLEKWEMTSEEKRCIIFNYIEFGFEKGILDESLVDVSNEQVIQHFVINEVYFKKINNGKKIDVYDLCDLRVALRNLCISKKIVDDIIDNVSSDLNVCSILENNDDSRLSLSMKKLNDNILEYTMMFIQGNIDYTITDKIYKYREIGVRNSLSFLKKIIFSEVTLGDLKIFSDVLVLFRMEFKLKQEDFVNIIFEVIERNLDVLDESASILLDCYFNKKQSDGNFKAFGLSDLEIVKSSLKDLKVNDYVVDVIVKKLGYEVRKYQISGLKIVEKNSLSSFEYQKYMGKLKTYICIDDNLPNDEMIKNSILVFKFLNNKEKSICIDLMEKLRFSDDVILDFLIKSEKYNTKFDIKNVIVVYENEVKGWLDFYREYEEYRDRISYIEELYEEFYSCYIDEKLEYQGWGSMLIEQINEFYLVIDSVSERNTSLLKRIRSKKES